MPLRALSPSKGQSTNPLINLMTGRPENRSDRKRYGYTFLAIGLALLISLAFRDSFAPYPFTLFWIAIAFSAWYGGFRSSLLALFLMIPLVNYFFVVPGNILDLSVAGLMRTLIFVAIAVTLTFVHYQGLFLYQTQNLFRIALANIADGVIVTDVEGKVRFLNPIAETITAWNQAEALGKPIADVFMIVHEVTREPLENPAQKALARQDTVGLVNPSILIARDGKDIPIAGKATPVQSQKSEVLGVILVFRDTTFERWAESALKHSDVRFRTLTDTAPAMVWVSDTNKQYTHFNPRWLDFTGRTLDQELGQGWVEGVHPDDCDRVMEIFSSNFDLREPFKMEYRLRHFSGAYRWIMVTGIPHYDVDQQFIGYIGSCVDITEHKRNEERTIILQRLTASLAGAVTSDEVADVILSHAMEVVGGDIGIVAMSAPDQAQINIIYTKGWPQDTVYPYEMIDINSQVPIADAIREQKIIWLKSAEAYQAAYPEGEDSQRQPQIEALICLPLSIDTKTIGAFEITFNKPAYLSDEDRVFLVVLSQYCAQAMDRAQLYEGAKTLAAIEERHRLARDLHDAISQTLFSISLIAESLPRFWERDTDKARKNLETLRLLTRGAHAEMRIMLLELRSDHLVKGVLEEQLQHLAQTLEGRKQITVKLDVALEEPHVLPPEVHETFYRITQEALSNIQKHAMASHVDIQLKAEGNTLKLVIQDNGVGIIQDQITQGLGLTTMSERAANIGALFELNSAPNEGVQIVVTWTADA